MNYLSDHEFLTLSDHEFLTLSDHEFLTLSDHEFLTFSKIYGQLKKDFHLILC